MQYKPLELAVNYFRDLYDGAKNIVQTFRNSLMPSGLELALEGVPSSVLKQTGDYSPKKSQGYFFAQYGVRDYRRSGRKVVVTRSDGKQISLEVPRSSNGVNEQYVKGALGNHGIDINNKRAKEIAKLLRGKS